MTDLWDLSDIELDEVSLVSAGDNTGAHVVLAKTAPVVKLKSSAYPDLGRAPGKNDNWIESAGGLPSYIERIAKHLHYERKMTIGHAIATAVNRCKKWAAGGEGVNPDTVAKAAAAIAQWEKMKGKTVAKDVPFRFGVTALAKALDVDAEVIRGMSTSEYAALCSSVSKTSLADGLTDAEWLSLSEELDIDQFEEMLTETLEEDTTETAKSGYKHNKPHTFCNTDKEKNGATKCDECGQDSDSPMHVAAKKRNAVRKFLALMRAGVNKSDAGTATITSTSHTYIPSGEEPMPELINKDDLPQEIQDMLAAKDKEISDLKAAAKPAADGQKTTTEKSEPTEIEKAEKDALAKADPVLRSMIEKAQAKAEAASADAAVEKGARIHREMLSKAAEFKNIPGTVEEKAALLKQAFDVNDEFGKALEANWKSTNAQLDDPSFLSVVGKSGAETTISKNIEAKIAEIIKADPKVSHDEAFTQVLSANPDMYDEIEKEGA